MHLLANLYRIGVSIFSTTTNKRSFRRDILRFSDGPHASLDAFNNLVNGSSVYGRGSRSH